MLDKFLPPTDNLYKFLAISGLLLIILSFVPNYFNFQLWEQKYEYLKNQKILEAELEKFVEDQKELNENSEELNQKYNDLVESYKEHIAIGENIEKDFKEKNYQKAKELYESYLNNEEINKEKENKIEELKTKIEKEKTEIDNKLIEIKVKNAEIDKTKNLIEYYNEEILRLRTMSIIFFALGIVTACSGFYLWYAKIQKINDKILENEGKEKQFEESENNKKT